jgi:hypothetical protein
MLLGQAGLEREGEEDWLARQPSFAFAEREASPQHTRHSRRHSVESIGNSLHYIFHNATLLLLYFGPKFFTLF